MIKVQILIYYKNSQTFDNMMEMQKFLVSTHRHQDCRNRKKDNSRDSLLVTSRGVSGGVSGVTGYQPAFFESKHLNQGGLIPSPRATGSKFHRHRLAPRKQWYQKRCRQLLRIFVEKYYQEKWCAEQSGKTEVVLPDRTRCDCLTKTHATIWSRLKYDQMNLLEGYR
jgi:hypothetical protein